MTNQSFYTGAACDRQALSPSPAFAEDQATDFAKKFNRASYQFRHELADHPLFRLPALIDLAGRIASKHVYFDIGDARPETRWEQMGKLALSPEELLRRIEHEKAWFFIRNAEVAPEYAEVLENCMSEAEALAGYPFRKGMKHQEMILFITSPKRVTTYHIDRECSFLLQVRGSKTIHVFDRADRDVLPEDEIERFWTTDHNAPKYRPELQGRATSYLLSPGNAVHIPVNFPHWLENSDQVSVSININIQFPDHHLANVYRANHFLRRLGMRPTPPQQSPLLDSCKSALITPLLAAKRAMAR